MLQLTAESLHCGHPVRERVQSMISQIDTTTSPVQMGRFPEEGPRNILGVPEGSHLAAVEASWSIYIYFFLFSLKEYLTICQNEKDLNDSSCLHWTEPAEFTVRMGQDRWMGELYNPVGLEIHMNNWFAIPVFKRQHHHVSWGQEPGKKETKKKPHLALDLWMTFDIQETSGN